MYIKREEKMKKKSVNIMFELVGLNHLADIFNIEYKLWVLNRSMTFCGRNLSGKIWT